jgi:hypothetical protein
MQLADTVLPDLSVLHPPGGRVCPFSLERLADAPVGVTQDSPKARVVVPIIVVVIVIARRPGERLVVACRAPVIVTTRPGEYRTIA